MLPPAPVRKACNGSWFLAVSAVMQKADLVYYVTTCNAAISAYERGLQ